MTLMKKWTFNSPPTEKMFGDKARLFTTVGQQSNIGSCVMAIAGKATISYVVIQSMPHLIQDLILK